MLYFWDPAYLKISLFYQYLTIHFIEYGPILLWKSISPQPLRAWFYYFLPSSAASEKSEIITLPCSFWILCMWPSFWFFFPTERFRIFKCSMKFHNMHWCWAKQSQILQFWVTFLVISLVISSPSIFSVLNSPNLLNWPPNFIYFLSFCVWVLLSRRLSQYHLPTFPLYSIFLLIYLRVLFYSMNVSFS